MSSNRNIVQSAAKRPSSPSSEEPPTKRQSLSVSGKEVIMLESSEDDNNRDESQSTDQKWFLCRPTASSSSLFWNFFDKFTPIQHPGHKDKAACRYCFKIRQFKRGTVSCKGGSTSGLKRHIEAHHQPEFEAQVKINQSKGSISSILNHLKPTVKTPPVSSEDVKRQFKLAATSWVIDQAVPFNMVTSASFGKCFSR